MNPATVAAYIGLGSNLDDPAAQVEAALLAFARLPRTRLVARSHLYRTAPWGGVAQPDFINAVAQLDTALDAAALMHALLGIERDAGRVRGAERYGPRVLDLDLLVYDDRCIEAAGLSVPHPRLAERAFVLVPLHEIAPSLEIPGLGRVEQLLRRIDTSGVTPVQGPAG
ncbi:MAG: 2-amino-4-hydroxy-6-hydroxymethyldihydropteridine diphosphokinase [Gammaproteobacteria bacterium]|nr:MAG: 2-amino-4-hydroxy-6-hydroxymethyldihydropteridine diphosphokinase [Gammaproteobacteria bacterium]